MKKYLTIQASSGGKRTRLGLAIEHRAEKVVAEYVHLSKDSRYSGIYKIVHCTNVFNCYWIKNRVQPSIQLYDRAVKVVWNLISSEANVCVWLTLMIDRCTKLRLKIDWTLAVFDGDKNVLQFATQIGNFWAVERLMN